MATIYIPPPTPTVRIINLLREAADIAEAAGLTFTATARVDAQFGEYHALTISRKAGGR